MRHPRKIMQFEIHGHTLDHPRVSSLTYITAFLQIV